jgi:hypothetical protein
MQLVTKIGRHYTGYNKKRMTLAAEIHDYLPSLRSTILNWFSACCGLARSLLGVVI